MNCFECLPMFHQLCSGMTSSQAVETASLNFIKHFMQQKCPTNRGLKMSDKKVWVQVVTKETLLWRKDFSTLGITFSSELWLCLLLAILISSYGLDDTCTFEMDSWGAQDFSRVLSLFFELFSGKKLR